MKFCEMIADPIPKTCAKFPNNERIERDMIFFRDSDFSKFLGIHCEVTNEPVFTKTESQQASQNTNTL